MNTTIKFVELEGNRIGRNGGEVGGAEVSQRPVTWLKISSIYEGLFVCGLECLAVCYCMPWSLPHSTGALFPRRHRCPHFCFAERAFCVWSERFRLTCTAFHFTPPLTTGVGDGDADVHSTRWESYREREEL